jgi:hypothetical protein
MHWVMGIHTGYGLLIHSELGWEFGVHSLSIWYILFFFSSLLTYRNLPLALLYTFVSTSTGILELSHL